MTEADWLACTNPKLMLEFLRSSGTATDRKLRLFACACCRRIFPLLDDKPTSRKTIEFAERFADGLATQNELRGRTWGKAGRANHVVLCSAFDAAQTSAEYGAGKVAQVVAAEDIAIATRWRAAFDEALLRRGDRLTEALAAADAAVSDTAVWLTARETARNQESRCQSDLLRCIVGNPFRIAPSVLTWNDGTVVRLATSIYKDRRFADMPVLGDALEEAGCQDQVMLAHCREQGAVHVRGCWVIDLLLN
jgi:hypothetical protein